MRKFAKIQNAFNSLKQQGLEQLDINVTFMTKDSQDTINVSKILVAIHLIKISKPRLIWQSFESYLML